MAGGGFDGEKSLLGTFRMLGVTPAVKFALESIREHRVDSPRAGLREELCSIFGSEQITRVDRAVQERRKQLDDRRVISECR